MKFEVQSVQCEGFEDGFGSHFILHFSIFFLAIKRNFVELRK